jgi:uncharacterized membrane protein YfcA
MTLSDPYTFAATFLAVALVGLSKGGLGGAFGLMGVPIMSVFMPPLQAAAVLLPIYLFMDAVSLWTWRGQWDKGLIRLMLPAALVGIGLGWATASAVSDDAVRLIVGIIGLSFVLRSLALWKSAHLRPVRQRPHMARFWSMLAGFTSFVAHAGGPPYQVYTMPLRMDPKIYTGTSVLFFAVLNAAKVIPYFALGQFDLENLTLSLATVPVAAIATLLGAFAVRRMRAEVFYPFMYAMILLVSLKLIFDALPI